MHGAKRRRRIRHACGTSSTTRCPLITASPSSSARRRSRRTGKRNEAQAEAKKAAEDAAKKKAEDDKAAVEREAAEKAEKDKGKKTKEAAKNAAKKNKRVVRSAAKDANYFAAADPSPAQIDKVLNDVDLVLATVDPDELAELASKLSLEKEPAKVHAVFGEEVARLTAAEKLKDGDASSLQP